MPDIGHCLWNCNYSGSCDEFSNSNMTSNKPEYYTITSVFGSVLAPQLDTCKIIYIHVSTSQVFCVLDLPASSQLLRYTLVVLSYLLLSQLNVTVER